MRPMVTSIITLLVLVFATATWGAGSQTVNYQGYLRNSDGTPVNSQVSVAFSLYAAATGGTPLWTEVRNVTPASGIYSVQLGSVTAFPAALFANDNLYLGVKVGSDAEMTPRQILSAAPYAFRARTADSILGLLQSGYLAATIGTSLNAPPAAEDSYRILLDQAITVTSLTVTTGQPVNDTRCAAPLLTLSNGTTGRDLAMPYFSTEMVSDPESLKFAEGTPLRLGVSQNLICPADSQQVAPTYKVVLRFRPTAATDLASCGAGTTACNGYCADTSLNAEHCGACGGACPTLANGVVTCYQGECKSTCAPGATMCDGQCSFTATDRDNCGGCGNHCGPWQVCSNGSCTICPSGLGGNASACDNACCSSNQVCGTKLLSVGNFTVPRTYCMSSCPAGTTACDGKCVDLDSDPGNCGACGSFCPSWQGMICAGGRCVCPDGSEEPSCTTYPLPGSPPVNVCATSSNRSACGSCGNSCAANQICSGGSCLTCASGVVCSNSCCGNGEVCQNGVCKQAGLACPLGQSYCLWPSSTEGRCIDTGNDRNNCGSCGHQCGNDQVCNGGQCVLCPSVTPMVCGNTCSAMKDGNCGACGITCAAGTACLAGEYPAGRPVASCCPADATLVAGSCQCPSGKRWCGDSCVDTTSDSSNCGACGVTCTQADGMFCSNGHCASCPSGQTRCEGSCVDTRTSSSYCGSCTNSCQSGKQCFSGVCATPVSCASGQTACNNVCRNLQTDVNNCGWCGRSCAPGEYCSAGSCKSCSATICNNSCVNLKTSNSNCGSCGHACGSGQICVSGSCQTKVTCSSGQTSCSNVCVDLKTDSKNCGFCGHACGTGAACSNGFCLSCSSGQTACNGACANLKSDPNNCGSCGKSCGANEICSNGTCQCPTGWGTCNGVCTYLQTFANCGKCGNVCQSDKPNCISGMCNPVCTFPQKACNGVCVDTLSDPNNCGSCRSVCPKKSNGSQASCDQGRCI